MNINPYLLMPNAASAWAEGFTKGFLASNSPQPSENVTTQDINAFNEGVAFGENAARTGFSWSNPCIPAAEGHGPFHTAEMVIANAHIAHGLWHARHLKSLAGGIAGIIVGMIHLACTLPVNTLPPEQVLKDLAQPLLNLLASYNIGSVELFCGAGLDATATDCEILLTPIFTSLDRAIQAAKSLNRRQWVVASWRTDQSNSFKIVDAW